MTYWKFVSTEKTEVECFMRRLFGNPGRVVDETGVSLDVEEGDILFLHRWKFDGPGRIDGPFVAVGGAEKNINPNAWAHKGDIDWHVEFDWVEPVYSRRVDKIGSGDSSPVEIKSHAQALSEVQGIWLSGALKDGIQTVSFP